MSGTLTITGAVINPETIGLSTLAATAAPVTVTLGSGAGAVTYTGVSVYSLISGAQFSYPTGVKNGALRDYIAVTSASGAQVVLSEGEVDPNFGGKSSTDIIAYAVNGVAMAPQLIVPGDIGASSRDIANVTTLSVGIAAVAPALASTATPSLTLSGLPAADNPYTQATLAQAGQVQQQADTFLQGTTPVSSVFTGTTLINVLQNAGLNQVDALDTYVVATGSDGYGVVYSEGEINPAVRGTAAALIAYDDGKGTFPSVGGVAGALRTTAPGDSKGGRYVSNLDSVAVATPNNDAVFRLYEAALGRAPDTGGAAFWSGLLDAGTSLTQIAAGFLQSGEFSADGGAGLSDAGFVSQLYTDSLGRSSDAGGAAFWTGLLSGGTSRSAVLAGFTSTAEAITHGATTEATLLSPAASA